MTWVLVCTVATRPGILGRVVASGSSIGELARAGRALAARTGAPYVTAWWAAERAPAVGDVARVRDVLDPLPLAPIPGAR